MGLLIMAVVGMDRFRLLERISVLIDLRSRGVTSAFAVTAGTVGTVSGGGALYFLVAYLKLACQTAQSFRGTNLVLSGFFMTGRMLFFLIAGLVTLKLVVEALACPRSFSVPGWGRVSSKLRARSDSGRHYRHCSYAGQWCLSGRVSPRCARPCLCLDLNLPRDGILLFLGLRSSNFSRWWITAEVSPASRLASS